MQDTYQDQSLVMPPSPRKPLGERLRSYRIIELFKQREEKKTEKQIENEVRDNFINEELTKHYK